MRSIVIGTAGHIDHGKTALVKALTGTDTDRLEEEKRKGITIELGFARLDLGNDMLAGIVDVPGHEKFVKNMVAGTAGIDMVMLVVAADEGIMPQTREHLDICNLLGIERGVVALTKTDLAESPEWIEMVKDDLKKELRGSFLEDSPVVAVSARSGDGMPKLINALREIAADIGPASREAPAFLAIDRAFSMKGFGTVVTGSLVTGSFSKNDSVDILPDPGHKMRDLKIRSLQVHNTEQQTVEAGHRLALNLANVERGALSRGQVVVHHETLETGKQIEGTVTLVPSAKTLGSRTKLVIHAGTARTTAAIRLIGRDKLESGQKAYARLQLGHDLATLPGQRFLLRGFNPIPGRGTTIGGGQVLSILPPRRRLKDKEKWIAELEILEKGDLDERLLLVLRRAGHAGLDAAGLSMRAGVGAKSIERSLDKLMAEKLVLKFDRESGRFVAGSIVEELVQRMVALLEKFHSENPLLPGMPLEQARNKLARDLDARLFRTLIERQPGKGHFTRQGDVLRLTSHRVELDEAGSALRDKIFAEYEQAALAPPGPKVIAERVGKKQSAVEEIVRHLAREGLLTHISGEMYVTTKALDDLRDKLLAFLADHGEISTQDFKSMVGASRKHAIPLAEFFDKEKITLRRGDVRVPRKKGS